MQPHGTQPRPGDNPHDLGVKSCAEVAERYAEVFEEDLWQQINAEGPA